MPVKINYRPPANPKVSTSKEVGSRFLELLQKDIQLFGSSLSDKKKEAFFLELSILFSAGVDIKTSLELMEQEQPAGKNREWISILKNRVISGSSLSVAVQATGFFSDYEYYSLQIGEETGKLSQVLKSLADFYANKIKQSRQVVSALSYPCLVLATSIGAIAFMMQFVVPMFSDIFRTFKGELPYITRVILSVSDFMRRFFLLFVISIIGIVVVIVTQRNKEWFRKYGTAILLRVPMVGQIIGQIYIARFCLSMALLTGAKVPIVKAIKLVRQMIGFYPIEQSLQQIEEDLIQGLQLYASIEKYKIYPRRMVSLIRVGEEVNRLEEFFEKIGRQYTDDVEHKTGMIGSFVEPVMIVFLGLVVGTILVGMYLPLFSIGQMMH